MHASVPDSAVLVLLEDDVVLHRSCGSPPAEEYMLERMTRLGTHTRYEMMQAPPTEHVLPRLACNLE